MRFSILPIWADAAALIVWAFALLPATAQEPLSVDLQAERSTAAVADPIWITLSATAPQGWSIRLPDIPEEFDQLRVVDVTDLVVTNDAAVYKVSRRFKVESLLPGGYQIDPLEVQFSPREATAADSESPAETLSRSTPATTIRIRSALGMLGDRRLREIDGPVWVPWTWRQWMIAASILIATSAIGFIACHAVGVWLHSRPLSQQDLLRQLDRLDESRLSRAIPNDRVVTAVADLVRQSLQISEGPRTVYRTTEEWIAHLQQSPADPMSAAPDDRQTSAGGREEISAAVETVLREADAVKFAGRSATLDQARRCVGAGRTIIHSAARGNLSTESGAGRWEPSRPKELAP